ncbi:MAG TPA: hypothetical protein ENK04_15030 [Gammaproteobacteria bacterium]|nr:hypothetical protein [Gammaproteobacteria bacterium]
MALLFSVNAQVYAGAPALLPDKIQITGPAIAYQPREYVPTDETSVLTDEQITADLQLLADAGFRSLVTYSSTGLMGNIPGIARKNGFDETLIMGIWDPFSSDEWKNAVQNAPFVDGYCIGNEGLGIRYTPEELAVKMEELRQLTGKPVTTSEPIDTYISGPHKEWLLEHSDWLFPIAHPYWAEHVDPAEGVAWVVTHHDLLVASSNRQIMLKEVGFPTIFPAELNENLQVGFFRLLDSHRISFFFFEAFDQPWKGNTIAERSVEAHWGIYRADGTPKKVVSWITKNGVNSE